MSCGTIAGYTRHRINNEPYCQDCRDACAAYERQRRRDRGIGPVSPSVCGTYSGYTAHYKRAEEPCRACKDAHSVYQRQFRREARRRARRGTIRSVVADYLETYDALTLTELVFLIQHRHPDITNRQIRDAVGGLLRAGRVLSDPDELGAVYRCEPAGQPV